MNISEKEIKNEREILEQLKLIKYSNKRFKKFFLLYS